ncbi:MAG: methylenetetrahydrofolate reductase small subunit [Acetobacterium sp.]|jgi:electron transport complex protein RnfC|uniref:methylenetetrahydrofolate reductase C-terminal domain-containing protein n=1 Tax=Acetobacterium TaxID=33951 RepID=UPI000DBEAE53|nr:MULTISPECIES: methylenetetrahydrofolate reductase C-terminal domain-containing protein [unclassified Acetobacterium]AWW27939.1 5,10-methylene tetrahydromethanopterin reductase [Acetobacterium sp. KB-1]MDK2942982.1 methylenetetrahydrofolate reductase small subunit [Acetobacterium sp.]MDZ5726730.1 methylenetetrahydrofolate reductase C-terminal domain-containing protein [Acetobacterium sp. K1/6]
MLITQLKSKETIEALAKGKTVIINCHGCKEVYFAEHEADELQKDLSGVTQIITTDYICNPDNLKLQLQKHTDVINAADTVLVFSCGVGVQTVAALFEGKRVYSCCDTYPLPGFQGVTPLNVDCGQCGECYLNGTGGICPITACSKSLLNGQCGGAKEGMCEVDKEMECGWERIYRKLEKLNKLDNMKYDTPKVRNYCNPNAEEPII